MEYERDSTGRCLNGALKRVALIGRGAKEAASWDTTGLPWMQPDSQPE